MTPSPRWQRRERMRVASCLLALGACRGEPASAPTAASGSPALASTPNACEPPPVRWRTNPEPRWRSAPALSLPEGRLFVGEAGERWLVTADQARAAPHLHPEDLVGALAADERVFVLGRSGTLYVHLDPLGPCLRALRPPFAGIAAATGRRAHVVIDTNGQTWRGSPDGARWRAIADLPPATTAARIVMTPRGEGLWWSGRDRAVYQTRDDGARWEALVLPGDVAPVDLASTPAGALAILEAHPDPRTGWGARWRELRSEGSLGPPRGGLDPRWGRRSDGSKDPRGSPLGWPLVPPSPPLPEACDRRQLARWQERTAVACLHPTSPSAWTLAVHERVGDHPWQLVARTEVPGPARPGVPLWLGPGGFLFVGPACQGDRCAAARARPRDSAPLHPLPDDGTTHLAFDADPSAATVWSVGVVQEDDAARVHLWRWSPDHREPQRDALVRLDPAPGPAIAALGLGPAEVRVALPRDAGTLLYRRSAGRTEWRSSPLPIPARRIALVGDRGLVDPGYPGPLHETADGARSWAPVARPAHASLLTCDPGGCWFDRGRRRGWSLDLDLGGQRDE